MYKDNVEWISYTYILYINISLIPLDPSKPVPPTVIDDLLYEQLNKVYHSIISAGERGKLANTTFLGDKTYEESLGGLLTMLDQIYANSPYSYTLKSSRDSLKLFEDNISYLTIKPKKHELITQGKASYNLELEQTNGIIYTAGVSIEFSKDDNRNVNATMGIGYKF